MTMSGAPPRRLAAHAGLTLVAVCLAGGLLPASLTGASVALPSISTALHAGLGPLQWVVNAYNLSFASSMLACGALADLVGRRRMFVAGTVGFGLCSLASALSTQIIELDIARAAAGIAAAAVLTSGSALLATAFSGPRLTKAFGVLGSSFGAGLALGPSTSGLLVSAFGWRSVFLVHAAVCLIVACAIPLMAESRDPGATRVDSAGTATFTGALLLTFAMVQGPQWGWTSAGVWALLAGFAVLTALFWYAERAQQRPMFDLSLLAQPRYVAVCLVPIALAFGFVCLLVFLPSYFIGAVGYSTSRAGLTMLILTIPVLSLPTVAGMAVRRIGVSYLLGVSLLLVGGGGAWLTVLRPGVSLAALIGPLVVIGIGVGISFGILDGAAISSVPPERAGMAAGMFNTFRLASEAIAIAGMGSILATVTRLHIASGIGRIGAGLSPAAIASKVVQGIPPHSVATVPASRAGAFAGLLTGSYTSALHEILWILAGVCVVGSPLIALLLRPRRSAAAPAGSVPAVPADELLARD